MAISYRLKKIIGSVTPCYTVADIGTDHGYVPISLLRDNIVQKAIAIDSSAGSLEKAVINGYRSGVHILKNDFSLSILSKCPEYFKDDEISTFADDEVSFYREFDPQRKTGSEGLLDIRLSDGLLSLEEGEVDSIVITGMGGILIRDILSAKSNVVSSAKEIIVSPQRDKELVVEYLEGSDYEIVSEEVIKDKNKGYSIIKAKNKVFD